MGKFTGFMIGSDFDGTYNIYGKSGIGRNPEVIKYFREEGGLFGIVTGRAYGGAYEPIVKDVCRDNIDFVVALNGAQIIGLDGEFIRDHKRDMKHIADLWEIIRKRDDVHFMGVAYGKDYAVLGEEDTNDRVSIETLLTLREYFHQTNIPCKTYEAALEISDFVRENFGDVLNPQRNGGTIDIPPAGVDKGTGLADVAESFGISPDNVYTAGDSYNDLAMITRFHGCAVENAEQIVKDGAETVVPDVAAVVEYIEKTRLN